MEKVKYIPGDLVKDKYQSNEIFKVTDTSKHGYILKSIKNDVIVNATTETLIGIPLTPAILEANGWEKLYNVYGIPSFYHQEAEFLIVTFESDNCRTYSFNTLLLEFKYLHELQHLLFGLKLNNNLKI